METFSARSDLAQIAPSRQCICYTFWQMCAEGGCLLFSCERRGLCNRSGASENQMYLRQRAPWCRNGCFSFPEGQSVPYTTQYAQQSMRWRPVVDSDTWTTSATLQRSMRSRVRAFAIHEQLRALHSKRLIPLSPTEQTWCSI